MYLVNNCTKGLFIWLCLTTFGLKGLLCKSRSILLHHKGKLTDFPLSQTPIWTFRKFRSTYSISYFKVQADWQQRDLIWTDSLSLRVSETTNFESHTKFYTYFSNNAFPFFFLSFSVIAKSSSHKLSHNNLCGNYCLGTLTNLSLTNHSLLFSMHTWHTIT